MPLCLAFNPPRDAQPAWRPCPLPASAGERLCSAHREQLDGVVLGLFHAQSTAQRTTPSTPHTAKRAPRVTRQLVASRKRRRARPRPARKSEKQIAPA
jgi:hypothetical protein